ncbi:hypothetical protein KC19_VG080300, partial [Ceratodon purpureus]
VAGGGVNAGPSTADGLNASRGTGAANATTDIPAAGVNTGIGNGGAGNRSTGQRTLHNNTQAMVRMLQQDSMAPWYEDCSWRREGDDPFGSDAFCGAIGCVKYGISFNISTKTLRLLPSQLAWFTYVLDLAMQGDLNLKNNGFHKQEMARCEEFIMANQEYIKKIELVTENDFQGIYNEVLEDEDEE